MQVRQALANCQSMQFQAGSTWRPSCRRAVMLSRRAGRLDGRPDATPGGAMAKRFVNADTAFEVANERAAGAWPAYGYPLRTMA